MIAVCFSYDVKKDWNDADAEQMEKVGCGFTVV